jgi:tetratricopeptide (TPR) repeat protein
MRTPTNHRSTGNNNNNLVVSSYSNLASQAIGQGKYRPAVEYYQLALEEYLKDTPTVVELVNAAATCFNLGALSKKLQDYAQAVDYFCQAEDLYRACAEHVNKASDKPEQSASLPYSCQVCLLQLIVETIQARAHLHYKYQHWIDDAIECHEEVVTILDALRIEEPDETVYYKIHFTTLPQEERWLLLITSLQSLGKFYVERGEFEDGLMAYQEALSVLKQQPSPTQQRQDEITQIVKALSEIYSRSNSTSTQVTELQRLALLQEDLQNWEKALQCWERVLHWQSQEYGAESIEVAVTLCQLARVMGAEGNHEGALDLYQAAATKYHKIQTPLPRELISNVSQVHCQLQLRSDAIVWLKDLLLQS